nr:MAG TPA: Protein of unknown function (DUF2634) [Caudoviricetes sp.]
MIPATSSYLEQDIEIKEQPSLTYNMEPDGESVRDTVDGKEALKQTIYRILNTERYKYVIYPWYYGIETQDLYGESVTYVCPELERRITEALTVDTRITDVSGFEHDIRAKGVINTSFTVHTIYGDIEGEKEVNV